MARRRHLDHDMGSPYHREGRVLVDLAPEQAMELLMMLPQSDGWSRDLWAAIKEAEAWESLRQDPDETEEESDEG